jgi:hypothetical protein
MISIWTFSEYFAHRFLLHRELNLDLDAPADGKYNAEMFSLHVHHHVFLNQKNRVALAFPEYCKFIMGSWTVLYMIAPASIMYSLLFGWFGGSILYDLVHYSYHHGPDL